MRRLTAVAAILILVSGLACAAKRVLVPARMDLHPYGKLGLVTFSVENAKGSLHQFATERFAENVLAAQPGIEILELGNIDTLMQRVGERELGILTAQETMGPEERQNNPHQPIAAHWLLRGCYKA